MHEPPARPPDTPADPPPDRAATPPARPADQPPPPEAPPREPTPVVEVPPPATVEDVRSLRRWLIVTGIWALAATAIAVIALVIANRIDEEKLSARSGNQIRAAQRSLEDRIDDLEARVAKLPTSQDVSDLENRLRQVENRSTTASNRLEGLSGRLDGLEQRVAELEQAQTEIQTQTETPGNVVP
jgi:uncharacterized protein DUF2730